MAANPHESVEHAALNYLRAELNDRAPATLHFEASFDEETLAGEGAVALFSFDLSPGGACPEAGAATRHYVVAGQTTPNYYPAFGLDPDGAFSLHVGTRFMLEMKLGRIDAAEEPPEFRAVMRQIVASIGPGMTVETEELAGLFVCEEQRFAVYRLTLGAPATAAGGTPQRETVYFVGGDCPPGFYRLTEHPPQVALRLHLGKLIRAEPAERSGAR